MFGMNRHASNKLTELKYKSAPFILISKRYCYLKEEQLSPKGYD